MRSKLLLAVAVALCFNGTALARGNNTFHPENYSKYQQDTRTPEEIEEDQDYEDGATDWEDHTVPSPQNDSQTASLAMCGKHTVFISKDDNVITVDGITYQLAGVDYRNTGTGDVALIDHYMLNSDPDKMVSLMVLQKSRVTFLYKSGEPSSKECRKPDWN